MEIKVKNKFQQAILDDFIKNKACYEKNNSLWIKMNLESLESLLLFSDKFWTPKFKKINSVKSAKDFVALWFYLNKKSYERLFEKFPEDYLNKNIEYKSIAEAEKIVNKKLDQSLNVLINERIK